MGPKPWRSPVLPIWRRWSGGRYGRGIVPTGRCFVVTPERFVLVFGALRRRPTAARLRRFAWCDQENYKAWDYGNVTSQAGFLDIEPASPIICARCRRAPARCSGPARRPTVSQFLGLPIHLQLRRAGRQLHAVVAAVAWSTRPRWRCGCPSRGRARSTAPRSCPSQCAVRPWIDDDIDDVNVREQACAVHVAPFNEFWWFFPQLSQPVQHQGGNLQL